MFGGNMIETNGATLRVSASYGLKVPGPVTYASEDAHYSFSLEQPVEDGITLEDLASAARDLSEALTTGVKLMAFTELDVAFEDKDGTLRPVITTNTVPTAAPPKQYNSAPQGRPASGNKGTQTSARATIQADLGNGMRGYLDNRGLKQTGEFKAGAADFRSVDKIDGRYHSVWIAQKDGTPNAEVVAALQGAGVSV